MEKKSEICIEEKGDVSNVLRILKNARVALKEKDSLKLSSLSDQTLHSATVCQDSLNIIVAVLLYALSKVIQRKSYSHMEGWKEFYDKVLFNLDLMIKDLNKGDSEGMILHAGHIREALNSIDGNLGTYIKDVFRKAEINKSFKLYEHGISSEQAASLLGVSLWDLASYIGQSTVSEARINESLSEKERVAYLEDFFK